MLQKSAAKWVRKAAPGGRFIDRRKRGETLLQKSINPFGCVVAMSLKCTMPREQPTLPILTVNGHAISESATIRPECSLGKINTTPFIGFCYLQLCSLLRLLAGQTLRRFSG